MDEGPAGGVDLGFSEKFLQTVNNDLNMPQAMAVVQDLLKSELPPGVRLGTVLEFDRVLGLDLNAVSAEETLPEEVRKLADARQAARKEKQWALSDQLRDQIQALGFTVQDTPQGMKVYKP